MDINKLKQIAYVNMSNNKSLQREKGYLYHHGLRTANLSLNLRKLIIKDDKTKDNILFVGALFHDISKSLKPQSKFGEIIVKELIAEYCSEEELKIISDIVSLHQFRNKQNTYSDFVKIVQDADIIDHTGTIDIWSNFIYGAYNEESILSCISYYCSDRYKIYLDKMRSLLNYSISEEIFDEKVTFVNNFIQRCAVEAKGDLIV